jgi:Uma2 family endonuclease
MSLLTEEEETKFAPVCPDFIVELKSTSDNLRQLKNKMLQWIENGVNL